MQTIFKKSFIVLSMFLSMSIYATPVTWQLTFTNQQGQVGNGQFSYDLSTTDIIYTRKYDLSSEINIQTGLSSVSFNLLGLDWGSGSPLGMAGYTWWDDPDSLSPGYLLASSRAYGVSGFWFFTDDILFQQNALSMHNFTQVSDNLWTGSWRGGWFQDSIRVDNASGSFTATLVPIPGALWLFFSSLVILRWKQKLTWY